MTTEENAAWLAKAIGRGRKRLDPDRAFSVADVHALVGWYSASSWHVAARLEALVEMGYLRRATSQPPDVPIAPAYGHDTFRYLATEALCTLVAEQRLLLG